jgi:mannose-1-phosphate guanylyltransferase
MINHPAATHELYSIILAGGRGRRLQNFLRQRYRLKVPKQFCALGGTESLLQQTVRRLLPLVACENVLVVVGAEDHALAEDQLASFPGIGLIEQPQDRGTAAAVLLALVKVLQRNEHASVLLTPADHGVEQPRELHRAINVSLPAVQSSSQIVLFGIEPTRPATDYGWITTRRVQRDLPDHDLEVVHRFVEKPDPQLARNLFGSGNSLWNSMLLLARANTLLHAFGSTHPLLVELFVETLQSQALDLSQLYRRIPRLDFSHDVLSRARGLSAYRLPPSLGWTDLGTPARLHGWLNSRSRPSAAADFIAKG